MTTVEWVGAASCVLVRLSCFKCPMWILYKSFAISLLLFRMLELYRQWCWLCCWNLHHYSWNYAVVGRHQRVLGSHADQLGLSSGSFHNGALQRLKWNRNSSNDRALFTWWIVYPLEKFYFSYHKTSLEILPQLQSPRLLYSIHLHFSYFSLTFHHSHFKIPLTSGF